MGTVGKHPLITSITHPNTGTEEVWGGEEVGEKIKMSSKKWKGNLRKIVFASGYSHTSPENSAAQPPTGWDIIYTYIDSYIIELRTSRCETHKTQYISAGHQSVGFGNILVSNNIRNGANVNLRCHLPALGFTHQPTVDMQSGDSKDDKLRERRRLEVAPSAITVKPAVPTIPARPRPLQDTQPAHTNHLSIFKHMYISTQVDFN